MPLDFMMGTMPNNTVFDTLLFIQKPDLHISFCYFTTISIGPFRDVRRID